MDLKERIDKLNDMCTDINNQVDNMTATLNAYNAGQSNALYVIIACSVDSIIRLFEQIYTTIITITKIAKNFQHSTKALLTVSNLAPATANSNEKKADALVSASLNFD
uniref:LXG domain-containing protein n=1 Tax=Elaeophora elaphi TaxID=1147741 RepID=A0A0R3RH69_9BILA